MYSLTDSYSMLHPYPAARRESDEKLKKLEGERASMESQVRETKESYQSLSGDLQLMTSERDRIMGEKRRLEVSMFHYIHTYVHT